MGSLEAATQRCKTPVLFWELQAKSKYPRATDDLENQRTQEVKALMNVARHSHVASFSTGRDAA